jgi:hypothetical protein
MVPGAAKPHEHCPRIPRIPRLPCPRIPTNQNESFDLDIWFNIDKFTMSQNDKYNNIVVTILIHAERGRQLLDIHTATPSNGKNNKV